MYLLRRLPCRHRPLTCARAVLQHACHVVTCVAAACLCRFHASALWRRCAVASSLAALVHSGQAPFAEPSQSAPRRSLPHRRRDGKSACSMRRRRVHFGPPTYRRRLRRTRRGRTLARSRWQTSRCRTVGWVETILHAGSQLHSAVPCAPYGALRKHTRVGLRHSSTAHPRTHLAGGEVPPFPPHRLGLPQSAWGIAPETGLVSRGWWGHHLCDCT